MQPVKLAMTAFGPFPGSEVIDFTRLGENPLFLINGPTGAGKTTILDAICFALYGKTTGNERDASQMRSDLADPATLCEVCFDFRLGDRGYQIRRIPEQQRPKARGEGFTEQKPEAQLLEYDSCGQVKLLVASKVSDATQQIEILTGLNVEQFRQVMVLPQGQFRQLLLAESAEREKIFGRLFQTHLYKKLEERFRERAREVRTEREALLLKDQGLLEGAAIESVDQLTCELDRLKDEVLLAYEAKDQGEILWLAAEQAFQRGGQLANDFDRAAELAQRLGQLAEQKERIEAQRQQGVMARQAQAIEKFYLDLSTRRDSLNRTREKLQTTGEQLAAAERQLKAARQEQTSLTEKQQQLSALRDQLNELTRHRQSCERLDRQLLEKKRLESQLQATQQGQELVILRQRLKRSLDMQKQQGRLDALRQRLEQSEARGKQLKEQYELARERSRQLELVWHLGQAAILASQLESGQPCPVCGSLDHPAKAQSEAALPDQNNLESARHRVQELHDELESARRTYLDIKADSLAAQADLTLLQQGSELEDAPALAQRIALLEQELGRGLEPGLMKISDPGEFDLLVQNRRRELSELQGMITQAEQTLPAEYRQSGALDRAERQLGTAVGQLEKSCEDIQRRLLAAEKGWQSLYDQQQHLSREQEEIGVQCHESEARWNAALHASDFSDLDTFLKALMDADNLQRLEAELRQYDAEVQQLTGASAQLQERLAGQSRPDLDQLGMALNRRVGEKDAATATWQTLSARQKLLLSIRTRLAQSAQKLAEIDRVYAVVGTLSDVANGQTGMKISLQRFVLSVLLEDVLLDANRRLEIMSKGRYHLLRKEDRSKGNKASGLELVVEDSYSGMVRPVATLSGGESFLAALALALGLSDVVQAYAGGIRLDTLFIDEGFGSLDPEALDLAIRTLIDLQSSGRTIGVISHVSELKEQIPLRIDVQSSRTGSFTRIVAC